MKKTYSIPIISITEFLTEVCTMDSSSIPSNEYVQGLSGIENKRKIQYEKFSEITKFNF